MSGKVCLCLARIRNSSAGMFVYVTNESHVLILLMGFVGRSFRIYLSDTCGGLQQIPEGSFTAGEARDSG